MDAGVRSIAAEVMQERGRCHHTINPMCPSALGLGHTALTKGCLSQVCFCAAPGLSRTPVPSAGVYVQEMADAGTAKLYAGLLAVGDEILQVNGAAVSGLGLAGLRQLLLNADSLSLRVLRHRPAPR